MRRALRAVVVAALVALPFTVGAAPAAHAACDTVAGIEICNEGMGAVGVDIPGLIHICIKFNGLCGS